MRATPARSCGRLSLSRWDDDPRGALGCDQAQGHYLSRPVPAAELDLWLNTRDITDDITEITGLLPAH